MVGVPRQSPEELTPGWPERQSPDRAAEAARQVALVVIAEVDRRGLRAFAGQLGLNHSTLVSVSRGAVWPSLQLVVALERVLDIDVWPDRAGLEAGTH